MEHGGAAATAMAAAQALAGSGCPWFWLDGDAAAPGERRVSYLGIAADTLTAERGHERAFLAALRERSCGVRADGDLAHGAGLTTGWIVALGYEFGVGLLGAEAAPDAAAPGFALRCDAVLVVDHDADTATVRGETAAAARLRAVLAAGAGSARAATTTTDASRVASPGSWRGTAYSARVDECRAAIRRGDAYVLCLTDTAEAETDALPLELYARMRGGAMRGGLVVTADRALVSASPERYLSVADGTVRTHPIKGTRPRGEDAAEDRALAEELAADPKERAENLMIVDLMRNDLTRVCEPGSVRVERFLTVESHPRVHQLVSTVAGELSPARDVFDAIQSCFPGGSMTGAPKRSAVEILGALEAGPRGLYSGCFGWVDDSGNAELAMTIRGVELRGPGLTDQPSGDARSERAPRVALVGAGGGITIDSDPGAEVRERDLKAAAMLAIL
ncbi:anthranilate synthase component I family protein [Leucobacter aridicollis]|uniref:Anthranilate synthase component 1 n=1 Tax=Leucobacter aridicollis TaxID=283878 RepID=A0A852RJV5_9MICO|nr:anthranilate synthase component I family protein [Leucobacter aridicollis]NYD26972.1 anthranilate synthase component 1 [Leucobacter aridicollis]